MPDSSPVSYRLDLIRRRLLRGGVTVPLGDRAFDLLAALAEVPGEPVATQTLMARVWPGVTVSPGNLRVQVRALRRALGDDAVENVPGIGYRLVLILSGGEGVPVAGPGGDHLVGRGADIDRLSDLLSRSRLVSVVGPGGVGKTSLALAASAALGGLRLAHVELAPVRRPGFLPAVTAAALSLRLLGADVMNAVRSELTEQPTLLLLDNAEHLLDEVASFVEDLLGHCPELRILLTSREPLGVGGEVLLHLCPLTCPPDGPLTAAEISAYPAVQLVLRHHAQAGWPPPDDAEMPALARLCRHLDGLPLALLLLAAWLRDCPVTEVERVLAGRFQDLLLPTEAGCRYDNLNQMLDGSIGMLPEPERLLLGRLTVFAGTWPVEAAAAVCGASPLDPAAVPGMVAGLVARSLVAGPIQTRQPGLRLLETIRQHVVARDPGLVEREGLRPRLCGWLTRRLRLYMMTKTLNGFAIADTDIDIADIRTMLDWGLGGGDVVAAQTLALDAYRLWNNAGPFAEIAGYLTRAWDLCQADTPPPVRAVLGLLLHGEGLPMRVPQQADRPRYAREELDAAVAVVRGPDMPETWSVNALISAGYIRRYTGDLQACLGLWREAVTIAEAQGNVPDAVRHLSLIGWLRADAGDMAGARVDFARALQLAEQHDLPLAIPLLRLADAEFNDGQTDRAIAVAQAALAGAGTSSPAVRQTLLANLASYLLIAGQIADAAAHALAALHLMMEMQYTYAHPWAFERGALIALRLGRPDIARRLAPLAERLVQDGRMKRGGVEKGVYVQLVEALSGAAPSADMPEVTEALAMLLTFYEHVVPTT